VDIEGFIRRYIKDEDEQSLQNSLKEIILEYKSIDPQKADQMAHAVIEEVKNTLKIDDYNDESLKELIKYPKAEVKMGEI
jgi:hydrogenase expression/formation protein